LVVHFFVFDVALGIAVKILFCGLKALLVCHKKDCNEKPARTPKLLFFYVACFFVKTIWAMSASAFATVASLEVVLCGKAFIAFGCEVIIFAFYEFSRFFVLLHCAKLLKIVAIFVKFIKKICHSFSF
jgi:hypothetical protein